MPYLEPEPTGKFSLHMAKHDPERTVWKDPYSYDNLQFSKQLTWQTIATGLERANACDLASRLMMSPMYVASLLVEEQTERKWVNPPEETNEVPTTQ